MDQNDIRNYAAREDLRGGQTIVIRAIRPEDKGSVIDTLSRVSHESLYRRLFSGKRNFSDDELKRITTVDFINTIALVAVSGKDEEERIVGGGRYVRIEPSGGSAEVAFLIDDAHQGLGIGSRLFKHLVMIARESGIKKFESEVLPSNLPMLNLFNRSGLPIVKTMGRDSVQVTIQLTSEATNSLQSGQS